MKLYVADEPNGLETRRSIAADESVATSFISYAEVGAAFAGARRGRRIRSGTGYSRILREFDEAWRHYAKVAVLEERIQQAGELAGRHFIKGFDSVHLASALALSRRLADLVTLSTWDQDLADAARAEGLTLAHEVTS